MFVVISVIFAAGLFACNEREPIELPDVAGRPIREDYADFAWWGIYENNVELEATTRRDADGYDVIEHIRHRDELAISNYDGRVFRFRIVLRSGRVLAGVAEVDPNDLTMARYRDFRFRLSPEYINVRFVGDPEDLADNAPFEGNYVQEA